jgi:hypothetical protein
VLHDFALFLTLALAKSNNKPHFLVVGKLFTREKPMFETIILVLLYNKEINESNTITSLLKSNVQYQNARIVIWNNGPKHIETIDSVLLENLGYDVVIEETLNNESLAVIYNRFIAKNESKKYILLDDDSVLNPKYILASSQSKSTDISMPIIYSEGEVRSPKIDEQPYGQETELTSKNKVITIGSGLVIGIDIVNSLKENYKDIFDERFYLYGVDTTFCFRIYDSKLTEKIKIISGFEHSLSRLEKEDLKTTKFRRLERSYDQGLTLKYYYPLSKAVSIMLLTGSRTLKRILCMQPHTVDLLSLLKAFLLGKHYRKDENRNS